MNNLEKHILEAREALDAALTELLEGEAADTSNRVMLKDMVRNNRYILQTLDHMLSDARKLDS